MLSCLGAWQLLQDRRTLRLDGWRVLELDLPNSPAEVLVNQFGLAYMIADFLVYLLPYMDAMFIGHHIVAGTFFVGALATGHGAIAASLALFLGEITSPILNTFTISRELRHQSKLMFRVFALAAPTFTASYLVVRTGIMTPVTVWFLYSWWFRSPAVPAAWRWPMGICILLGYLASQAWSAKLIKGHLRRRHRPAAQQKQTASATERKYV